MQNINNLKDEVINLEDIIIKNLQDKNKRLETKVYILENKIIDLEIQNNDVDQYSRRNNVKISGIPQLVSNNQLEQKVVDILKAIDVNITTNETEACHHLGKKNKNVVARVINRKHCLKALRNKKKLKSIDKNAIDGEVEKCYTINGIVNIAKNKLMEKIFRNSSQSMSKIEKRR